MALLLILAACGVGSSALASFAVARFAEINVCAAERQPRQSRRTAPQQLASLPAPRPTHRAFVQLGHWSRELLLALELFQRPPPSLHLPLA
jgi:hypothetical protein